MRVAAACCGGIAGKGKGSIPSHAAARRPFLQGRFIYIEGNRTRPSLLSGGEEGGEGVRLRHFGCVYVPVNIHSLAAYPSLPPFPLFPAVVSRPFPQATTTAAAAATQACRRRARRLSAAAVAVIAIVCLSLPPQPMIIVICLSRSGRRIALVDNSRPRPP